MTNIVSAEQVADLTGVSVDHATISRAQFVITTETGVQLGDADIYAALSLADQTHLATAVVWQVVYFDAHPEAFSGEHLANVVRASANGASIEFAQGSSSHIAPLAARALGMLSWRQQSISVRTLRPYRRGADGHRWVSTTETDQGEVLAYRGAQPDPWRSLL